MRLAEALADQGRAVALVAHPEPPGQARLPSPKLPITRVHNVPPLREARGDLSPFLPAYRDAIRLLADRSEHPVVLCPTLLGDAFGLAAHLARESPDKVRIVGWQHADIPYDTHILAHYEPLISRFAGVSRRITDRLQARLPHRLADIAHVPNGVLIPASLARREPLSDRPLRLVYTGRLEHDQKRILALIELSRELRHRGIAHSLRLIGDGPASGDLRREIASLPIETLGPLAPPQVADQLDHADLFVLASRWEGLSVSMLEAMARGCVPVVTRVDSGAPEAVTDAQNGILVDAPAELDLPALGHAMADGVQRALALGLDRLSRAAADTIRARFSLAAHAAAAARVIDAAAAAPPPPANAWPADRPCAFTTPDHAGTLPHDAAARLRAVLAQLVGRTIIIHGAGQHTRALIDPLSASRARIVAIADDDRARWNSSLHTWPIISPADAAATGATDVVLSSFLHEDDLWARRAVYESQGLRVWRLYPPGA